MLVQIEGCPGRMSTMPSIMDSPTLVRVERAMLRHEEGSNRETASFNGTALAQLEVIRHDHIVANIRGLPFESGIGDNGGRGEDIVRKRERNWKSKLEDSSAWSLQDNSDNRLSLLTDIDISSYDSTIDSPLVATHGHNRNTYLSDEKGLSIRRSYRSTTKIVGSDISVDIPKEYIPPYDATPQFIKFRERSHSDIQKIDRQPWKICASIDSTPLYN